MARINLKNEIFAVSIENVARGVYLDDGAEFRYVPSDMMPPIFPTRDLIPDNMVGSGSPYARHAAVGRINPRDIAYAGALNSTMGVRLVRTHLGGAIVETARVVPGTIDSAIAQKAAGAEPMFYNVLKDGLLHGDSYTETIEITQSGDGEPRIASRISNTGHFKALSDTAIDVADIEAMVSYLKARGYKSRLTWSDGVTTYNPANESGLIDVAFTAAQNVIVEGLPGDLPINAAAECQGSYAKTAYIDVQSAQVRAKCFLNEDFLTTVFSAWLANRKITSVSLIFKSCEIIGLTTDVWELEIKIPVGQANITPDTQGNFGAYNITIDAIEGDPTTKNLWTARVRQVGSIDETIA